MKTTTVIIDGVPVTLTGGETVDLDQEDYRTLEGERVTNTKAQAWADEYARYGALGGRPSLASDGSPSVHKAFRITAEKARQLNAVSKERGVPESAILRDALDAYLAAETNGTGLNHPHLRGERGAGLDRVVPRPELPPLTRGKAEIRSRS